MPKIGKISTSKKAPDQGTADLLQGIADDASASALLTVAQQYLKQGDRKHLAAAIHLLGLAYERDRTNERTLELLSFAFEKKALVEKTAKKTPKVNPVRVEIPKDLPSSPSSPG